MINKKIGIIGGGQLALMLIQAASKLGVPCICLDPNPQACAFKYCQEKIIKNFDDQEALKELEAKVDVILFEFENINLTKIQELTKIFSSTKMLEISQNRIKEKQFAQSNGFNTPKYLKVVDEKTLQAAIAKIGLGGILKTCELGYDGKGQIPIKTLNDVQQVQKIPNVDYIYEEKINFDYEVSVIVVRSKDDFQVFPLFKNKHLNGILHRTDLNNNGIDSKLTKKVVDLAKNLMLNNNFLGILCIEMFIKDEQIYFNELAPRPHNSGHITLDSTNISQFDLYVRAALGLNLIKPRIIQPMSMINILGQNYQKTLELLRQNKLVNSADELFIYLYGKDKIQINRKMGHINIIDEELITKIDKEFKYDKQKNICQEKKEL